MKLRKVMVIVRSGRARAPLSEQEEGPEATEGMGWGGQPSKKPGGACPPGQGWQLETPPRYERE